jgi:nicotinamidase-related amidase
MKELPMFQRQTTVLAVIDLQERLVPSIAGNEAILAQTAKLIAAAGILKIPILVTEQYPEGIGPTVPALKTMLGGVPTVSKRTFSCCREPGFMAALEKLPRCQILICGIETHVCIYQTVADLVAHGYQVQVAADAVSSRTEANKAIGLTRIQQAGGGITSVESALFELLETSACPEFKPVVKLIK